VGENAPLEAFGGGAAAAQVGQAAHGLAEQGMRIQEEAMQEAANLSITEAEIRLAGETSRISQEIEKTRGRDSLDAVNRGMADYDKISGEIINTAPNDLVRQKIRQSAAMRRIHMDDRFQRYASGQVREYSNAADSSLIEVRRNEAIENIDNPEFLRFAENETKDAVRRIAFREGLPGVQRNQKEQEAVSALYRSLIWQKLVNEDSQGAVKLYDAVKGKVHGDDKAYIEQALERATYDGEVLRWTDAILAGEVAPGPEGAPAPGPEGAPATIQSVPDKYQAAVRRNVKAAQADQKAAVKEWKGGIANTLYDRIEAEGIIDRAKLGPDYDFLDPSHKEMLSRRMRRNMKEESDIVTPEQKLAWIEFSDLPKREVATMPLDEFRGLLEALPGEKRDEAINERQSARSEAENRLRGGKPKKTTVDPKDVWQAARQAGVLGQEETTATLKLDGVRQNRFYEFGNDYKFAVEKFAVDNDGRLPNSEEAEKIAFNVTLAWRQKVGVHKSDLNPTAIWDPIYGVAISDLTEDQIENSYLNIPKKQKHQLMAGILTSSVAQAKYKDLELTEENIYDKLRGPINRAWVEHERMTKLGKSAAAIDARVDAILLGEQD
jgi:hypothetical protein